MEFMANPRRPPAPKIGFSFFQTTSMEPYKEMGKYILENKNGLGMSLNKDGVERVQQDNKYAYIMESPYAEYEVNRNCNLVTIGEHFRIGYYAFAFQSISVR